MIFALMALVTIGLGAFIINEFDDDDSSETEGQDLVFNGQETLTGTEGDDTIDVTTEVGKFELTVGGLGIEGGTGNDSFNLTLELIEGTAEDPGAGAGEADVADSGIVVHMSDFTPGEDTLTVEIDRTPGNEDREMSGAELVPFDTGFSSGSDLILTFAASDNALEATATIRFTGDQEITLDDIVILQH